MVAGNASKILRAPGRLIVGPIVGKAVGARLSLRESICDMNRNLGYAQVYRGEVTRMPRYDRPALIDHDGLTPSELP